MPAERYASKGGAVERYFALRHADCDRMEELLSRFEARMVESVALLQIAERQCLNTLKRCEAVEKRLKSRKPR
jgi:hypothetical protein